MLYPTGIEAGMAATGKAAPASPPAGSPRGGAVVDGPAITGRAGKIAFQTVENVPIPPIGPMLGRANRGSSA